MASKKVIEAVVYGHKTRKVFLVMINHTPQTWSSRHRKYVCWITRYITPPGPVLLAVVQTRNGSTLKTNHSIQKDQKRVKGLNLCKRVSFQSYFRLKCRKKKKKEKKRAIHFPANGCIKLSVTCLQDQIPDVRNRTKEKSPLVRTQSTGITISVCLFVPNLRWKIQHS